MFKKLFRKVKGVFTKDGMKSIWSNIGKPLVKKQVRKVVDKYIDPILEENLSDKTYEKVSGIIDNGIDEI